MRPLVVPTVPQRLLIFGRQLGLEQAMKGNSIMRRSLSPGIATAVVILIGQVFVTAPWSLAKQPPPGVGIADARVLNQDALTACLNTSKRCDELPAGMAIPPKPGSAPAAPHTISDQDLLAGKPLPAVPMSSAEAIAEARALSPDQSAIKSAIVTASKLAAEQLRQAERAAGLDESSQFAADRQLWVVRVDAPFRVPRGLPGKTRATLQGYVVLYDVRTHSYVGIRSGRAALSSAAIRAAAAPRS